MKKFFITAAVVVASVCTVNAQYFVGGSFNIDGKYGKEKKGATSTDNPASFGFKLSPKFGYYLSDKFAIGGKALFGFQAKNNKAAPNETITTTLSWEISPFARYSVVEIGKFAVVLEGALNFGGSLPKRKYDSKTTDLPSTFSYGIDITPLLTYNLSNKFTLELALDLLSYNIDRTIKKDKVNDTKEYSTSFEFGVDSDNVFSGNLGAITIGFIYKF